MHIAISVCIRRSPYTYREGPFSNPRMHTEMKINPCMHTGTKRIPVCIRGSCVMQSSYAYGDQYLSLYANGDHKDNRMHTGIAWHEIPVCIRGLRLIPVCIREFTWSPYAYWDCMSWDPRMHTVIKINPSMHMEIAEIPVCIRGSHGT